MNNYTCGCKPKQKLPHVVLSPAIENVWSISIGNDKKRKSIILWEYKYGGISCDGKYIPVRKWKLFGIKFGRKIVA